jgi:excisionase family DNA binding protein
MHGSDEDEAALRLRPGQFPASLQEPCISVSELCAILRVKRGTIGRLITEGALPGARKVGRLVRIPVSSSDAYLTSSLITTTGQQRDLTRLAHGPEGE